MTAPATGSRPATARRSRQAHRRSHPPDHGPGGVIIGCRLASLGLLARNQRGQPAGKLSSAPLRYCSAWEQLRGRYEVRVAVQDWTFEVQVRFVVSVKVMVSWKVPAARAAPESATPWKLPRKL